MADPERKQIKLTINMLSESQYQQLSADGRLSSELSDQLFMTAGDAGGGGGTTLSCKAGEYAEELSGQIDGVSGQIGGVSGQIDGVSGQIGGVSGQIDGVQSQVQVLAAALESVRAKVEQLTEMGGNSNVLDYSLATAISKTEDFLVPADGIVYGIQSSNSELSVKPSLSADGYTVSFTPYTYFGVTSKMSETYASIQWTATVAAGVTLRQYNGGYQQPTLHYIPFKYGKRTTG